VKAGRARPVALNYTFVSFDGSPDATTTNAQDINALGVAVGLYRDSVTGHGFVRAANGAIKTVDVPGASETGVLGINDLGVIVGYYADSSGQLHGFKRNSTGAFTTIDFPGAVTTFGSGINDHGDVVGSYVDAAGTTHGFLLIGGKTQLELLL